VAETPNRSWGEGLKAKLLLIALAFAWGINWPANKTAVAEINPWTFRVLGLAVGAVLIAVLVKLRGRSLALPSGKAVLHVFVAGMLNVGIFSISSTFALLDEGASRVVILVYTMPIWTSLLARFLLGEKLTALRVVALALCAAGLVVLLVPNLPLPSGLWYALITAWAWAGGTVYMKWAKIDADAMTIAAWQIVIGFVAVAIGTAILHEPWFVWPQHPITVVAWIYTAVVGVGLAYFMWFIVLERLPASTAALASLLIPIIGVSSSALMLGERPTLYDTAGFVLIFSAAACVILQPSRNLVVARAE
jgi:drug/metabolite transporter (DMT)-like permease